MGVTQIDVEILERLIKTYNPKSVIELGAQNNYAQPLLPAPYMREWYEAQGITYQSIDLNGECGALQYNLAYKIFEVDEITSPFDLVTDFGTTEHVGIDGAFAWEAVYNCWKTKFLLTKGGGVIVSENPKTVHWPGHGFQWFTKEFYTRLSELADLQIILIDDEICAMGNCETGKNVLCAMIKTGDKFPDLEAFKSLDLRQS